MAFLLLLHINGGSYGVANHLLTWMMLQIYESVSPKGSKRGCHRGQFASFSKFFHFKAFLRHYKEELGKTTAGLSFERKNP